jgi:FSR family fosmidomycin resistance protein-like MFS transporter
MIISNLLMYGIAHAMIDGICAAMIGNISIKQTGNADNLYIWIILYNVLAFGFQSILGIIIDYFKSPKLGAILGSVFVGLASVISVTYPIMAFIFAGLGNALFHVGGGTISLNLTPKKAIAPGIFVAPGALGLFVGTMIGKNGQFSVSISILILIILVVLMLNVKKPIINYDQIKIKINKFELILFLVFLSIIIRSTVGLVIVFSWKTNINWLIFLTMMIVLSKGIGGYLADKFGWTKMAVGSLLLSIPFLIFGKDVPYFAILGMFFFNITMPITLVIISNLLPGRPGFAFGITCLALIMGALPAFSNLKIILGNQFVLLGLIITSSIILYRALKEYSFV